MIAQPHPILFIYLPTSQRQLSFLPHRPPLAIPAGQNYGWWYLRQTQLTPLSLQKEISEPTACTRDIHLTHFFLFSFFLFAEIFKRIVVRLLYLEFSFYHFFSFAQLRFQPRDKSVSSFFLLSTFFKRRFALILAAFF